VIATTINITAAISPVAAIVARLIDFSLSVLVAAGYEIRVHGPQNDPG
jgi:1-acyl-sn-glycerol-3-phosphate acyltransferase